MNKNTRARLVLVGLYCVAVALSFGFSELRYRAMAFHTRDYAFYMQFASKLLDPQVPTKTYTINPDGYNLFFFGGTEGEDSFYQSVHLEPAKYFFAGVYRLFGHPRALFLFLSLVYFFPVLYLALVGRLETGADRAFALLVMLLYVAYPSSLKAPGFDARPFILLAPFFAMSVMSVTFQRPLREQVVLMNCMFLSREEALVFALVVIGYAFLKTRDGASRRRAVAALSATWLLWFMATLSFFMWTGYRNTIHARFARLLGETPASLLMAAAVLACAVCLLVFVWKQERLWLRLSWRPAWQILGFCSLFPPLIFQFVRERSEELTSWNGAVLARTAFSPRFALHATVVALLLTILWDLVKDRRQRAAIGAFVTMATALAVTVTLTSPFGVRAMSASYLRAAPSSGPVFALREATDRRRSRILTDYDAHQAFFDYENAYSYERLPVSIARGDSRMFPTNRRLVEDLIRRQTDYLVVSRDSAPEAESLLTAAHRTATVVFENSRFIAYRLQP